MVRKLIDWSVANPFLVLLAAIALAVGGGYAFINVNVEAYPDPAPAIIEVVAQFPGASAEEVERQVTIPLEVALAGMSGLDSTRSKSLFGLAHLRNQFDYSRKYDEAKQDVINLIQGHTNLVVRAIGLYGNGQDPMVQVLGMKSPAEAAGYLRAEEARRIREIRQTVVTSVNNVPVRVDQLVDGGPKLNEDGTTD